jgi:amidohydrolase
MGTRHSAQARAAVAGRAKDLPGTVVFVFQPAEEGAPEGEEGGALLMIKEGVLDNPKPDAIFGMHLWSTINVGEIGYRSGPTMAGSFGIQPMPPPGRAWRCASPRASCRPLPDLMQTIVSRSTDITRSPVVVSVGSIHGGIRFNIIPETVELLGAIRTFEPQVREATLARLKGIAEHVAIANGATARFEIPPGSTIPLVNEPALTQRMVPVLQRAVGTGKVHEIPYITASEDYARYADKVPSFFFFVGTTPAGRTPPRLANHSRSPWASAWKSGFGACSHAQYLSAGAVTAQTLGPRVTPEVPGGIGAAGAVRCPGQARGAGGLRRVALTESAGVGFRTGGGPRTRRPGRPRPDRPGVRAALPDASAGFMALSAT